MSPNNVGYLNRFWHKNKVPLACIYANRHLNLVSASYPTKYHSFMDVIALSQVYIYKSELTSAPRHVYKKHKDFSSDSYSFIILIPVQIHKINGNSITLKPEIKSPGISQTTVYQKRYFRENKI